MTLTEANIQNPSTFPA